MFKITEHYYSKKPNVKEVLRSWESEMSGKKFIFTTSPGVFSKNEVDFGSRLLVDVFEKPDIEGDILDLGCGYGPIGLSIARDYPEVVVKMIDINERAVKLARLNAEQNNVENVVIQQGDGFEGLSEADKYAVIITNPPIRVGKEFIYQLFEQSKSYLKEKGELWIVIQKKQGAPSAQKFLEEHFKEVTIEGRKKGYFIIRATNH